MSERSGIGTGWNGTMLGGEARLPEDQPVEEEGEAGREQRRADAGDVLADAEHDGEERHQQPGERAGQQARRATPSQRLPVK